MIKIIVLIALIKLLIATDKPLLCAGLYTFVGFVFGMLHAATGELSGPLLAHVAINFL